MRPDDGYVPLTLHRIPPHRRHPIWDEAWVILWAYWPWSGFVAAALWVAIVGLVWTVIR